MIGAQDVRLRPATGNDGPAIQALVFSVLEEYDLAPDPGGTDSDLRDIESTYQRRGGPTWLQPGWMPSDSLLRRF
jgi:hypothetical protein